MKKEIAESLNVDINSIHINSVDRGSVILLITIDEKGTTEIYKDAILISAQFDKWSINRCLKGKNINNYYKNTNKNFNENTKMWQFLKQKFGGTMYNSMKQESINKYNEMKNKHSSLIKPLSFDQIAAIYLYTTEYLYKSLNFELRDGKSEFADFTVELICGINKLPLIWTTTYRGLGPNFTKYHSYIPNVYKKGSVIRWDGMNSTSKNKNVALRFSDKWVIEIDGYHGRDIQPFSVYKNEDEIIYIISSHFIVTNVYDENGKTFFKVREMPFPWNNKAILWVDDKPTNNKGLMERLEKKGIMIIHDALQFISYMKNVFLDNNKFHQFRVIISDNTKYDDINKDDKKNIYNNLDILSIEMDQLFAQKNTMSKKDEIADKMLNALKQFPKSAKFDTLEYLNSNSRAKQIVGLRRVEYEENPSSIDLLLKMLLSQTTRSFHQYYVLIALKSVTKQCNLTQLNQIKSKLNQYIAPQHSSRQGMKNIILKNIESSSLNNTNNNDQTDIINNRNAGAILVNELRKQGYKQKICIFTSNGQKAIDECKKFGHTNNIQAISSTDECFKFAAY